MVDRQTNSTPSNPAATIPRPEIPTRITAQANELTREFVALSLGNFQRNGTTNERGYEDFQEMIDDMIERYLANFANIEE